MGFLQWLIYLVHDILPYTVSKKPVHEQLAAKEQMRGTYKDGGR